jgi:hypothetical protein
LTIRRTIISALSGAALLWAADQIIYSVPIWNGRGYIFARLGPGLAVANGQLDVVVSSTTRKYDVVLAYDVSVAGWRLPTGAGNPKIYVNGFAYIKDVDYAVDGTGLIKAKWDNMPTTAVVVADFDTK